MNNLLILIKREIKLILRNSKSLLSYSSFFFISLLIFVFTIGPDNETLKKLYVPILWVIVIFSLILISESFVLEDYIDGSLSELQFLGYAEEIIFLAKCIAMFCSLVVPNIILIPITSIFFGVDLTYTLNTIFIFFLSLPTLTLITILSAFMSLQIKRNKFINFILVMPFFIPTVIFSTSSNFFNYEINPEFKFFILIGLFLITLPITIIFGKLIIKEINY